LSFLIYKTIDHVLNHNIPPKDNISNVL
jgi:hypothetical protein